MNLPGLSGWSRACPHQSCFGVLTASLANLLVPLRFGRPRRPKTGKAEGNGSWAAHCSKQKRIRRGKLRSDKWRSARGVGFLALFRAACVEFFNDKPKAIVKRGDAFALRFVVKRKMYHFHTIYELHDLHFGTPNALHIILYRKECSKEPLRRFAIDLNCERGTLIERRNEY